MKSKKGTYILLVVVCVIWIGIAIEIINAFSDEEAGVSTLNKPIKNKPIQKIDKEVFTISNVERDPFLGAVLKKKFSPKKARKKEVSKTKINWPRIQFKGLIKDKKGNSIYLIEVNNQVQLMKVGALQSDIKLISGSQSNVLLDYKKEQKEFDIEN